MVLPLRDMDKICWNHAEIESVVENPSKKTLTYHLVFPEVWANDIYYAKQLTFSGLFSHSVEEMPFTGRLKINKAECLDQKGDYFTLGFHTSAGLRKITAQDCSIHKRQMTLTSMHQNIIDAYVDECHCLSITARLAIALLSFERFCHEKSLMHSDIQELIAYLWKWPLIDNEKQFAEWDTKRPVLMQYALGESAKDEFVSYIKASEVEEAEFRFIVSNLIDTFWRSIWHVIDKQGSLAALKNVLTGCRNKDLPPLTLFKFSLFKDNNGWGRQVTQDDYELWKVSYQFA